MTQFAHNSVLSTQHSLVDSRSRMVVAAAEGETVRGSAEPIEVSSHEPEVTTSIVVNAIA
jgi:hypothetical protein